MLAARASGLTEIFNISLAEDILSTINALKKLGVRIEILTDKVLVYGIGLKAFSATQPLELYMGNSGTSARLLMGFIASSSIKVIFTGDESLSNRPMERVLKPLANMGITYEFLSDKQLPCSLIGNSALKTGNYSVSVTSAQVKSSLLFANLPCNISINIEELNNSRDHTEIMFKYYGLNIVYQNGFIQFRGGKEFTIGNYYVPSDPSSAAFIIALIIFKKITPLNIKNICINPTRTGFIKVLQQMGCNIDFENIHYLQGEKVADLKIIPSTLKDINIGPEIFTSMIDEYPIFSVIAAYSNCKVSMTGLDELKYKESNRIALIEQGLISFGYDVSIKNDSLIINKKEKKHKINIAIKTAGDHRIAMSFIILAILHDQKIIIDNIECINTSFPNFFTILQELGINDFKLS